MITWPAVEYMFVLILDGSKCTNTGGLTIFSCHTGHVIKKNILRARK